ncbi:hypothetical protein FACS1894204_03870 [Synergistales bacterium]|nr:hypothetical protein FACS1894204_03870 [Synergistales bacterium]
MSNPTTLELVTQEATVPAPDNLLVGPKGAVHTDVVRVRASADATLLRGTLLMSGSVGGEAAFIPATAASFAPSAEQSLPVTDDTVTLPAGRSPITYGILADTVDVTATTHASVGVYFEGDFNENAVILPWETANDDHAAQLDIARDTLRAQKIFLREVKK